MLTRSASRKMNNIVHIFQNTAEMSKHLAPSGFPERPVRLTGIEKALVDILPDCKNHIVTAPAPIEALYAEYGEDEVLRWEVECATAGGKAVMDESCSDIYWSAGTLNAVRFAIAAAHDAIETVLDAAEEGRIEHAFAVIRPPGHHCFNLPAGFCIANNLAVAARGALARGKRVAIVDWDYHFGDGTAEAFRSNPKVAFCSLHCDRDRFGSRTYPASKWKGDALAEATGGRMFNIQWERDDADNAAYISAFDRVVLPAFRKFAPDVVLVSAGYDAIKGDALAGMELSSSVFYELTVALKSLGVPVVCVLEGGYDPGLLGAGVRATVEGLLVPRGDEAIVGAGAVAPQHERVITAVTDLLKKHDAL